MYTVKPGDKVFAVASCDDTLQRGSGVCWFYENGGCPFEFNCADVGDVLGVFESVVDDVNGELKRVTVRGLDYGECALESVPLHYVGAVIFKKREEAVAALRDLNAKREQKEKAELFRAIGAISQFCAKSKCEHCQFYDPSFYESDGESVNCCMFRREPPFEWKQKKAWE